MGTWGELSATSEGGSFFSLTSFVRRSESPRISRAQSVGPWVGSILQLGRPPSASHVIRSHDIVAGCCPRHLPSAPARPQKRTLGAVYLRASAA